MSRKTALVTGHLGNLGVYVTRRLLDKDYHVTGIDSNARAQDLGEEGDVSSNVSLFREEIDKQQMRVLPADVSTFDWTTLPHSEKGFDVIIHAASQVSHPRSIEIPMRDFQINAQGTIQLLEYVRKHSPQANFIYIGSAKVYGENVDKIPQREFETRWDYNYFGSGISESCSVDQTMRTPFGCSKLYADIITQEYGKLYGLQTSVLRPSCFAGKFTKPTIYQRWEAYIMKQALAGKQVMIYGHKGKQVRDILHCDDLTDAIMMMIEDPPTPGDVFNIGGARRNSISVIELLNRVGKHEGKAFPLVVGPKREGDWRVFITDNTKLMNRYPRWRVTRDLDYIIDELYEPLKEIIASERAASPHT